MSSTETEDRIPFYKETISPVLNRAGLANEKELNAYPDLLSYGDKIADEQWRTLIMIYHRTKRMV